MFSNLRNRLISVITPGFPPLPSADDNASVSGSTSGQSMRKTPELFTYRRPPFLQLLTDDEIKASADHNVRPIIVPRDISLLPWGTGYAECVNSGKSVWNEDQGAFHRHVLSDPSQGHPDLPYTYFGIFDGHAGHGAAVAATHQFHHILHKKLVDCLDILLPRDADNIEDNTKSTLATRRRNTFFSRRVSKDDVIIGALESAFFEMDDIIEQNIIDRFKHPGGCTACVALFINGNMYVANAGDSRAVLCQRKSVTTNTNDKLQGANSEGKHYVQGGEVYAVPFSFDHTPETERQRLMGVAQYVSFNEYNANEYAMRPHADDLGLRILCRQGTMKGWTYKTVTRSDLLMPVVMGGGKRSRLLGTLGVTRGFGDHHLLAINTGYRIKPFLTPHPDVNYRDLTKIVSMPDENNEDGDYGVLILGTDGLWDVSENDAVALTVFETLSKYSTEKYRYTMVAQELVAKARGKVNESGHWRLADSKAAATVDDISVFVIPVYQYYKEHVEWEQKCMREYRAKPKPIAAAPQTAAEATKNKQPITQPTQNGVATAELAIDDGKDKEREKSDFVEKENTKEIVVEEEEVSLNAKTKEDKLEQTIADKLEQTIDDKLEQTIDDKLKPAEHPLAT